MDGLKVYRGLAKVRDGILDIMDEVWYGLEDCEREELNCSGEVKEQVEIDSLKYLIRSIRELPSPDLQEIQEREERLRQVRLDAGGYGFKTKADVTQLLEYIYSLRLELLDYREGMVSRREVTE